MPQDHANAVRRTLSRPAVEMEIECCRKLGVDFYTEYASGILFEMRGVGANLARSFFINSDGQRLPMQTIARMSQFRVDRDAVDYPEAAYAAALTDLFFEIIHD